MRRLALGLLGFTGAFLPLMSLSLLSQAVSDGLEGARLPALSNLVLNLAPIGPAIWIIPVLVAIGIYLRTGRKVSVGDTLWATVAAILMFGCVSGALLAAYSQILFMDGPDRSPYSTLQWTGNLALIGISGAFLVLGLRSRKTGTEQAEDTKPDPVSS